MNKRHYDLKMIGEKPTEETKMYVDKGLYDDLMQKYLSKCLEIETLKMRDELLNKHILPLSAKKDYVKNLETKIENINSLIFCVCQAAALIGYPRDRAVELVEFLKNEEEEITAEIEELTEED